MNRQLLLPVILALFVGASVFAVYSSNTHPQLRSTGDNDNTHQQFQEWKLKYNKKYSNPDQESFRYSIFSQTIQEINAHNSDATSTYQLGLNEFSDLTTQEFNQSVLMTSNIQTPIQRYPYYPSNIPNEVNYIKKLTPIQNQGNCASGWAFATTENNNFQYGSPSYTYSVQNLLDCVTEPNYKVDGCKYGNSQAAFNYVNLQGQSLSGIYPSYTAQKNDCQNGRRGYPVGPMSRGIALSDQYFQMLQTTILASTVDASSWKNYASGVFSGCQNSSTVDFNHVINVVGYNLKEQYLTIRNSWGTSWGENGYMKLSFHSNSNPCGVFTSADYFIDPFSQI